MAAALLLSAAPAWAHGAGGRLDLPIPAWQLAWAASFAVAASAAALGFFWSKPRLATAAIGKALPSPPRALRRGLATAGRALGLAAFAATLYAALWGSVEPGANISSFAVYIIFWVGMPLVTALLGDAWAVLNPFYTLADLGAWARARATGRPMQPAEPSDGHHWWAVASIFCFAWLELAYHDSGSPRAIGVFMAAYAAAMLAGACLGGRGWVRGADGFGVLFTKISALAPLWRDESGVRRVRFPLAGLSRMPVKPGTVTFILTVLGSTAFDGFTRSSFWLDITSNRGGWTLTAFNTGGLVFVIGMVMFLYRLAIMAASRITGDSEADLGDAFGPSLIPIALAYTTAHYFSFLVFEGQMFFSLLSDPLALGWDLFGTASRPIDYTVLSPDAIAWIQTAAIALGHIAGVAAAHDRALERYPSPLAVRSQYPMLAVMIAYTIGGLLLLLGA